MTPRQLFDRCVAGLPAVTTVDQWGSHVAKVGDKVFALIGDESGAIIFKVGEMSFEGLTSLEGIRQAPYFAKRHWVSVESGALGEADLVAYIAASHEMIARKLTRKRRAELGLGQT